MSPHAPAVGFRLVTGGSSTLFRYSHRSTTGQLCSVDTIRVLHTDGVPGSVCGLGQFVPVRYVEATAD